MKRKLKAWLPDAETMFQYKAMAWLKPWLGHPRLWHMHRESVARGIAIGIITGVIPGPVQILLGALAAVPFRANVPAAAFATLYTNPFTFVPLYLLAYQVGQFVTGNESGPPPIKDIGFDWAHPIDSFGNLFAWIFSLGDTLLIGLAVQCFTFALIAYVLVKVVWRCAVGYAWTRRHRRPDPA